ncbi:hypothetical protein OIDMADRAFT_141048 [Oidiodendron maius Zn]|uniref:Uncharacterized protein n=1 Tax=Oidiodendron maius (strain Zn) TaxID=913774 RepID=A0A0C3HKI1_OIDMZ|nr:hypothetical protein OIDMADRAFT_141048 [Oidiodendron maius Zn]
MVFWSRAHLTTRIKQALSVDFRERDELVMVVKAQDALMAKLEKLIGSLEEYHKELSKRERAANGTLPSAWKWPLTDNEFMLQIQELQQWRQALIAWSMWIEQGRDASKLAWNCIRHKKRKQDIELAMMRQRAGADCHEWKRFNQARMSREGMIVQVERDVMAFDKEIIESKKRWIRWCCMLNEEWNTLADGTMGGGEDEKGSSAQWKLWGNERNRMEQEKKAMELEWTRMHIHLRAPAFCRTV